MGTQQRLWSVCIPAIWYEPSLTALQFMHTLITLLIDDNDLGQVVQNIVSLTSLLVVKILTVLVSTISNSQVFLLKKCE